ncbi:MAG TPA: cytochrome c [Candidatus Limnocylindria bacterium]|jgi:mono/diheme cytochrome c family protein|nr:cytochrome c [Candidatus Limnocylindria bacterium]
MRAEANPLLSVRSRRSSRGFGLLNSFLLTGSAVLLVWGGLYVGKYGGRFDGDEYSEIPHGRPAKVSAGAEDPNAKVLQLGKRIFNNCAACHQADGGGDPSKNIPPLVGSDWVLSESPNRIIRIVLNGLGGPVTVKGTVWQGNNMNPWRKTADNPAGLSDEEIAAVLSYARNTWGNKASIITPAQVTAIAKETEKRTDPWTAAELLKVPLTGGATATAALTPEQLKAALHALPAADLEALLKDLKK